MKTMSRDIPKHLWRQVNGMEDPVLYDHRLHMRHLGERNSDTGIWGRDMEPKMCGADVQISIIEESDSLYALWNLASSKTYKTSQYLQEG